MGSFGTYRFDGQRWTATDGPPTGDPAPPGPHLTVEVYDSDYATVTYQPADGAAGACYLGFQPRDYFEDPAESPEVDLDAEAQGLVTWADQHMGAAPDLAAVRGLLAEEAVDEPLDVFVEVTVGRLCSALGLPMPPGIPG